MKLELLGRKLFPITGGGGIMGHQVFKNEWNNFRPNFVHSTPNPNDPFFLESGVQFSLKPKYHKN